MRDSAFSLFDDASSDVCCDQDAVLTRAMWTTTAANARPVPFHGKRGLDKQVSGARRGVERLWRLFGKVL